MILKLFSFNKVYTSIPFLKKFFPGKTEHDKKSKQKIDFSSNNKLSIINPFTWFEIFQKIKYEKSEKVIFQWFHPILTPSYFTLSLLLKIFTKTKIIFECHNVYPHEPTFMDGLLIRIAFLNCNYFIVHSNKDLNDLNKIKKKCIVKKSFIPSNDMFQTKNITKIQAKKKLKITGDIILFFGYIKEYKGLKYLLNAMPKIKNKKTKLLVVGEFYDDIKKYQEIIKKEKLEDRVELKNEYVKNEDVACFFQAADIVVLPYVSATQSGIIQIAYSLNKPVIATNVGGLPEVIDNGKTGYVVKSKSKDSIAKAIDKYYNTKNKKYFEDNIKIYKKKFEWDSLVNAVEDI